MDTTVNMTEVIQDSFTKYSGAVLQSRALIDVRDCLKPSTRQIFYSLYTDKFLPSKPYKKTLKAVGSAAKFYVHGDSSVVGILMRSSQNFALRYPLIEVDGNNGSLIETDSYASQRYTSSRLSHSCMNLFEDIEKDTIEEWRDNYDDTEQYPSVLPSKGFYNIVNGSSGIAIGLSSSICQHNIKDVNKALETLLLNPDATFEELYCPPDFATGGYLINEQQVKNTLKYGTKDKAKAAGVEGAACKLRAVIDYDKKDNCLIVSEMPYGVYTNTVCKQLEGIINDDELNIGIDKFIDLTGEQANIKIYLKKGVDPEKIKRFLYKNTSLQYHYSINMIMLEDGRYPKVYGWKEALQAHIDHEKEVYRRGFEFDLRKIENKLHILDGLLICLAAIDEVIATIKSASSTADANSKLQSKFLLDNAQAEAVLNMKLSRLAKLEVEKIQREKEQLSAEKAKIEDILNNTEKFNNELIKGWRKVAEKLGDEHRTKIISVNEEQEDEESIKPQECVIILADNTLKRVPVDTLKTSSRNTKGSKIQKGKVKKVIRGNTINSLLLFSNKGKMYRLLVNNLPESTMSGKGTAITNLLALDSFETITAITIAEKIEDDQYLLFLTKNGIIKKTVASEYLPLKKTGKGVAAIKLKENDNVFDVLLVNQNDEIIITTKSGKSLRLNESEFRATGRNTIGVKGISLSGDDAIISFTLAIGDAVSFFSESGNGTKCLIDDIPLGKKGNQGVKVSDNPLAAATMANNKYLIICDETYMVINDSEIPIHGRGAKGVIINKSGIKTVGVI
jgi:DNA gyrase subunit A